VAQRNMDCVLAGCARQILGMAPVPSVRRGKRATRSHDAHVSVVTPRNHHGAHLKRITRLALLRLQTARATQTGGQQRDPQRLGKSADLSLKFRQSSVSVRSRHVGTGAIQRWHFHGTAMALLWHWRPDFMALGHEDDCRLFARQAGLARLAAPSPQKIIHSTG
jgi:hypothetical protein